MTEGRFEKGRWVTEPLPEATSETTPERLEERVTSARTSFAKGLDELIAVSKDLVTTEEGRQVIGRSMDKAGAEIMGSLEDATKKATDYFSTLLEQTRKR